MEIPEPPPSPPPSSSSDARPSLFATIRNRIISGLVAVLPIAVTFWIVSWLYGILSLYVLQPMAEGVQRLRSAEAFAGLPGWWDRFVAPLVAILLVLTALYLLGLFVRSRLYRILNWFLERVPVVATIYLAVRNVSEALLFRGGPARPNRVVLVEFPQPGMRSLGLVTNSVRDTLTGKTILSVCVLTGVMPPAGFTLLVPEESVTDLGWSMNQMFQAILSGGLSMPGNIPYFQPVAKPQPSDRPAPPLE